MEIYYSDNKLYVQITDQRDFSLINRLKKKLYHILDLYMISNIELTISNNDKYDITLIDDLLKDYNNRYNGIIIVK